jgi:hypothetical protein
MSFDSEQHVGETPEHVRTDSFAFEASCESEHEILINRDREVVRPEIRESLDKRAISGDPLTESRAGFGNINRSVHLTHFHERCNGIRLIRGIRRSRRLSGRTLRGT